MIGHGLSIEMHIPGVCTGTGEYDTQAVLPRYMGSMSWADIYSLHEGTSGVDDTVSYSTLCRAYEKSWRGFLKFRNAGQHAMRAIEGTQQQ